MITMGLDSTMSLVLQIIGKPKKSQKPYKPCKPQKTNKTDLNLKTLRPEHCKPYRYNPYEL